MNEVPGQVQTPLVWARFAVDQAGLVSQWLTGASVYDPTLGTGNLLLALVEAAIEAGHPLSRLPFDRLAGSELDPALHGEALAAFRDRWGVDLSGQLRCEDFFAADRGPFDVVLGNPPWVNYCDLPEAWKPRYKALFRRWGLVGDARSLLLGGARIDVAALVVQAALVRNVAPGGGAWFYLPQSLLVNQGAHTVFRRYEADGVRFAPTAVWDFGDDPAFPVQTAQALVSFVRDQSPTYPLTWHRRYAGRWRAWEASPGADPTGPLSVSEPGQRRSLPPTWELEARSVPRQGINTGGANAVYYFDAYPRDLPAAWVYPVATRRQIENPSSPPERWVLLPYRSDGRLLSAEELAAEPELSAYLARQRPVLEARRGALLSGRARVGVWWSLLGVGPYSMAPYKVLWEAYGRKRFRPVVLEGRWQANQALQAYVPCWSSEEALRVWRALCDPRVEDYLLSLGRPGTMSWAQPGRLRPLFSLIQDAKSEGPE